MPKEYESLLLFPSLMLVAHKENATWQIAFEGTATFQQIVQRSPTRVFSIQARAHILGTQASKSPEGLPDSLNLKWPWRDGQSWIYTQGPHNWNGSPNANGSSLDFAPPWAIAPQDREVRAAATGTVKKRCDDGRQVDIVLTHGSYTTGYLHLASSSASQWSNGATVSQGARLGVVFSDSFAYGPPRCGYGSGPHLHFYVGTASGSSYPEIAVIGTTFSGWTLGSNRCFSRSGQSNKCEGSSIASDNNPANIINIGQTVNADINPAGDQDNYYFDGTGGQNVTIEMTRVSGNVDPYIILYRPNGMYLNYNDDGAGFPNARLNQNLPDTGRYRILARSYSSSQTGAYTLRVSTTSADTDDRRWLMHNQQLSGTIDPANDEDWYYFSGIQGRIVSIRMNRSGGSLDSYLELYSPNGTLVAVDDDGGGWSTRDSWLVTTLSQSGVYRIKARSYRNASSGAYTIRLQFVDPTNYALNRPAWASSVENSNYIARYAFDGRNDTRWSSNFSDYQWIYVDLGQNRTFDSVILRWETAYGRRFGIYVWTGSSWRNVFWTNNGRGGTDNIRFAPTTARYVMMYGIQRGTPWGYSLWEFGVYNSAAATAPIVPPEDPDKPPDDVAHTAPLPLPEEEGGKDVIALYLGDGDNAQEIATPPDTDPGEVPTTALGQEGNPIASIDRIVPGYPGGGVIVYVNETLQFSGSAQDSDTDGDPGIVAYEWRSDRDGLLSTEQSFTRPAASLSVSQHVISFRAQDNEGNWSEWAQVTIQVNPATLYLPFVLR